MPARDPGSKEQFPAVFPLVKSVLDIQPTLNDDDVQQQRPLFDRSYLEHGIIFYSVLYEESDSAEGCCCVISRSLRMIRR